MEGITDRGFRRLIRQLGGCGLTVTEFVSSEAMTRDVRQAWECAEIDPDEHPVAIQIYGRNPDRMAAAARYCEKIGADLVDLNLGCPSKAVVRGKCGAALMREPERASEVFSAVKEAVDLPMTVKMRLGWDENEHNASDIAQRAQAAGAEMVVVHGRTREQMFRDKADWNAVRDVVDAVDIPVVVNGDILTVDDAFEALERSGAQGLMCGRGIMRNPWLLRQIADALMGQEPTEPTLQQRHDMVISYFEQRAETVTKEIHKLGRIKKVVTYFTKGLPGGAKLRKSLHHCTEVDQLKRLVGVYFETLNRQGRDDAFRIRHNG